MSFTVSTIPFLALIAILYVLAKKQLFPVLMFCTIFQGAAIVTIGGGTSGLPLAPAQIVLVLLILQKILAKSQLLRRPKSQTNVTACLLAYGAYALITAIFCPFFFAGIPVSNPRSGMGAPLTWGMYNVTQSIYLFLGIALYWLAVYRSSLPEIKRALDWYLAGATLASFIAIYQFAAFNTGLPFPSELLHSNTQHVIFEAYDLGGFTRVNSTFTEAAAAAGCFSTALALALYRLFFVGFQRKLLISFISLLTGLILTRSTTGYVALAFIVFATLGMYLKKARITKQVQLFRIALAAALLIAATGVIAIPSARSTSIKLLDTVVLKKTKSSSYEERTAWNQAALTAASNSAWFGAGWGSLRASSLVANILGTVGIPGLILFTTFVFLNVRFARKLPFDRLHLQKSAVLPILVSVLDCVLAGPEMTDPVVWFLFGAAAFLDPTALFAARHGGAAPAVPANPNRVPINPPRFRTAGHGSAAPIATQLPDPSL